MRIADLEGMLRVLDCVYAAGCIETSWDRAVAEMCRGAGFGGCALISVEPRAPEPVVLASHGLGERAAMPRNPLLTAEVLGSAPGTVWQHREVMRPALLATTSYWTDWMQPRGLVSWAGIVLGRDGGHVVCLEVYDRSEDAASSPGRADLLAQLAPHLTRAWRLGEAGRPTPQPGRLPAVSRLRAEFGLTKAEARLALALAEGASLAGMAAAFDVKLTTVRSQLQQVFGKTGTSRQAELVSLLLSRGYLSPVEPVQEPLGQRSGYASPTLQGAA